VATSAHSRYDISAPGTTTKRSRTYFVSTLLTNAWSRRRSTRAAADTFVRRSRDFASCQHVLSSAHPTRRQSGPAHEPVLGHGNVEIH
jgi:hypothetical protein